MNKIVFAIFLVGFWLFLPIGMLLLGVSGYDSLQSDDIDVEQPTGILGIGKVLIDGLKMFFNMLIFNIPNVHEYIVYFVRFLQFLSVIVIIFLVAD